MLITIRKRELYYLNENSPSFDGTFSQYKTLNYCWKIKDGTELQTKVLSLENPSECVLCRTLDIGDFLSNSSIVLLRCCTCPILYAYVKVFIFDVPIQIQIKSEGDLSSIMSQACNGAIQQQRSFSLKHL